MAKDKIRYECAECGAESPRWAGQCAACGGWNCLVEVRAAGTTAVAARGKGGRSWAGESRLETLDGPTREQPQRMSTGFAELDRVLGGGLVPGAVILIGGDPGIGKSTLLLQMLLRMRDVSAVYVTGEESVDQVRGRAQRLKEDATSLRLLAETEVERVLDTLQASAAQLLAVDSVQTLFARELASAPGSVAQLRECAAQLVRFAKQRGVAVILVGHVTKEGVIAGPRVLEHMVDTVLYFESDPGGRLRMIRAAKNRFGAVNELGFFAMQDTGLSEVRNPSAIFLARRPDPVPGSVVTVAREGTRPLLIEVQALTDGRGGRRVAVGVDGNRLVMLLAVLHRHGNLDIQDQDVFVNIVGGVQVRETALDLALVLAITSSFRNRALPLDVAVFGEIGLAGELRPVAGGEERIREAGKQGFTRLIVPAANAPRKAVSGITVRAAQSLREALEFSREWESPPS
ncbi:MAG: DNA repair protein RadA [Oceanococcaceae bacterium]